ncbi:dienelactone hydrolase endo-1,3,1,4-beta-D-glucanase [Ganoderma leucocontextum]|nr:dienelactone hydrolase endo-1,3,1,4-beta-D-glucanase [Ganoderma leucocontextum]
MSGGHCDNCFQGVRHEGTPEGKIETIAGIECYVATPSGDYPKEKVILFLTDVFGIPLINNKLLVDDFARNGYRTIMPDILEGDARSLDPPKDFDRNAWLAKHGADSWGPIVDAVVQALHAEGVTWIGTTGYCFGTQPVWRLALKGLSTVSVVAHVAGIRVPEDLQEYFEKAKAPLLINSSEIDPTFPQEAQKVADEIFSGKFAPGYERTYWDGCTHGFAVRGDLSDPKAKAGKEGAFEATVKFFNNYSIQRQLIVESFD